MFQHGKWCIGKFDFSDVIQHSTVLLVLHFSVFSPNKVQSPLQPLPSLYFIGPLLLSSLIILVSHASHLLPQRLRAMMLF